MIQFLESPSTSYSPRTYTNVTSADVTVAFACNFLTAGEKLTKHIAERSGKEFIAVDLTNPVITLYSIDKLHKRIKYLPKNITINVAGNGIYTLTPYGITQEFIDSYVAGFLSQLFEGFNILSIRSGGQTGADEAGLKAAIAMGVSAISYCPKGWKFRNIEGVDISDKTKFISRFYPDSDLL